MANEIDGIFIEAFECEGRRSEWRHYIFDNDVETPRIIQLVTPPFLVVDRGNAIQRYPEQGRIHDPEEPPRLRRAGASLTVRVYI